MSARSTRLTLTRHRVRGSVGARDGGTRRGATRTRATGAARKDLGEIDSRDSFDKLTAEDTITVVDFQASWCRKCMMIKARLQKLAATHEKVRIVTVDVNKVSQELIRACGVTKMPTLQIYRSGKMLWELIGAEDGDTVSNKLHFELERLQAEEDKGKKKDMFGGSR